MEQISQKYSFNLWQTKPSVAHTWNLSIPETTNLGSLAVLHLKSLDAIPL